MLREVQSLFIEQVVLLENGLKRPRAVEKNAFTCNCSPEMGSRLRPTPGLAIASSEPPEGVAVPAALGVS